MSLPCIIAIQIMVFARTSLDRSNAAVTKDTMAMGLHVPIRMNVLLEIMLAVSMPHVVIHQGVMNVPVSKVALKEMGSSAKVILMWPLTILFKCYNI